RAGVRGLRSSRSTTSVRRPTMTKTLHRSEDNAGTAPRASANVRHLSRMELPGGGQVVIQGQYAFVGHQHRPDGTTILDVSDPRTPKIVSKLMTSHPMSHSHKVRVVGDTMLVNSDLEPAAGRVQDYPVRAVR